MSQVSFDMPASDLDEPEQGKKLKKIILLFYKTMNSPLIKDQEFKMKEKKKKKNYPWLFFARQSWKFCY